MILVLVFILGLFSAFIENKSGYFMNLEKTQAFQRKSERGLFFLTLIFFSGVWGYGFFLLGGLFSGFSYYLVRMSGVVIILLGLAVMEFLASPLMSKVWFFPPLRKRGIKNPFLRGFYFMLSWLSYWSMTFLAIMLLASGAKSAFLAIGFGCLFTFGVILGRYFASKWNNKVGIKLKKRTIVGLLLVFLGIVVFFGYSSVSNYLSMPTSSAMSKEEAKAKKALEMAQDFSLKDEKGNGVSLSDFKGKTVFLNFWATWCHACEQEMPHLEKLYHDYGSNQNEVVFLTVAMPDGKGDVSPDELRHFIKQKGYSFPVLFDEKGEVFGAYGVRALPTTYMITKEGELYGYVPGAMTEKIMKEIIESTKAYVKQ